MITLHNIRLKDSTISNLKHELAMTQAQLSNVQSQFGNVVTQAERLLDDNTRVVRQRDQLVEENSRYLQAGRALDKEVVHLRDEVQLGVRVVQEMSQIISQQRTELFLYYDAATSTTSVSPRCPSNKLRHIPNFRYHMAFRGSKSNRLSPPIRAHPNHNNPFSKLYRACGGTQIILSPQRTRTNYSP